MTQPVDPSTTTILVVDDDPNIRRLLVTVLTEAAYDVLECNSGREALVSAASGSVGCHLVVLDLEQEDVFAVLGEMRQHLPQIPMIILISERFDVRRINWNTSVIRKPFKPSELVGLTHQLIRTAPPRIG